MRLLNAEALVEDNIAELDDFVDESHAPKYAILSHTWEDEEVLFQDIPLGPKHLVQPSAATLRAMRRHEVVAQPDSEDSCSNVVERPAKKRKIRYSPAGNCSFADATSDDTFRELVPHVKQGWDKVRNTCRQAIHDGLTYVWIDTCCIDKSSSAELSEAINSMYRWYQGADVCYVYLSDCSWSPEANATAGEEKPPSKPSVNSASEVDISGEGTAVLEHIRNCRWFTRGWTLQELIAPRKLHFFDSCWQNIAEKRALASALEAITGIDQSIFRQDPLLDEEKSRPSDYSVAQRMSWASRRKTTRKEDEAYCLLGLFGINMPLIYGEGHRAFQRLQEEIIRTSKDQSIFAWELLPGCRQESDIAVRPGLLAPSPANFGWIPPCDFGKLKSRGSAIQMTSQGIEVDLRLDGFRLKHGYNTVIAWLSCVIFDEGYCNLGIWLQLRQPEPGGTMAHGQLRRAETITQGASKQKPGLSFRRRLILMQLSEHFDNNLHQRLLISPGRGEGNTRKVRPAGKAPPLTVTVEMGFLKDGHITPRFDVLDAYPPYQWSENHSSVELPIRTKAFASIMVRDREYDQMFIIIIGITSSLSQIKSRLAGNDGLCRYWIWPGLAPEPGPDPVIHGHFHHYLKIACDRAALFELKDYFEHTAKRQESRKTLRLADGGEISAYFIRQATMPPRQVLYLKTERKRRDTLGSFFEEDFFQTDRLW